jgi:small subunit ribosomal protein S12
LNGRKLLAYIPGFGHNLSQHSTVLLRGGRVRDVPGMHYKLMRGKFDFLYKEKLYRSVRRSKFGYPNPDKANKPPRLLGKFKKIV